MQGKVLAGRYRLITKLGEGGMGSVWRAEHLTLRTQVAIKLMDPSIAESSEALARFQREAQSAAELRSTHIVQIMDYGVDGNTPFIAMELLEGESLAARLHRLGKLTASDMVQILSQVTRALTRAHDRGIVHRDLKPDNIFIVREGDTEIAKVLDFGIAKKISSLSASSGIKTHTGALLGTPYYASPEQALGRSDIDHRTDIWSLGIIAYECLTGQRPFEAETLGAILMAICHDTLPTPSKVAPVPQGFDAWFACACARDMNARFQSVAQAAAELRVISPWTSEPPALSRDLNVTVPSPPTFADSPHDLLETASPASVTVPGPPKSKSRWLLASLVLAALGLGVVLIYGVWGRAHPAATTGAASTQPGLDVAQVATQPEQAGANAAAQSSTPTDETTAPPVPPQPDQLPSAGARGPLPSAASSTAMQPRSRTKASSMRPAPATSAASAQSAATIGTEAPPRSAPPAQEAKPNPQPSRRSLDMKLQ